MIVSLSIDNILYTAKTDEAIDLSLSFGPGGDNPNAFHIPGAQIHPIRIGDFVGSVAEGSGANCDIVNYCPHGNGTHTECLGHIAKDHFSVNKQHFPAFLSAQLISVELTASHDNLLVSLASLLTKTLHRTDAIIIRSLPNEIEKRGKNWSGSNPAYFESSVLQLLREKGYKHLLTDLPSVDPEEDEGALLAHHVWWDYPENPRMDASITELIFVPSEVPDGLYLLNLQIAPVEDDAAPSRPLIFPLIKQQA